MAKVWAKNQVHKISWSLDILSLKFDDLEVSPFRYFCRLQWSFGGGGGACEVCGWIIDGPDGQKMDVCVFKRALDYFFLDNSVHLIIFLDNCVHLSMFLDNDVHLIIICRCKQSCTLHFF